MVVTRFAPSPTGYLHVGGARTAIFNWVLARKMKGRFILRIEDTDLKRNTPTATDQVLHDLRWLGLEWDEGPDIGGPNGPYLQSQRLDIYNHYVQKLIDSGKAYYCFETSEENDASRQQAQAEKKTYEYQRPEVFPDRKDMQKAISQGRPVAVRFAVPQDKPIVVNDIIRGAVTFAAGEIGDFVIQKSDGFPTYHFAVVVDDQLMGVTHVIRGQEHLMNTPGHQALQQALGFDVPVYAHMSVTVSPGGGKLSKREHPKALLNVIMSKPDIDRQKLSRACGLTSEQLNDFIEGKSIPDMPVIDAMAQFLSVHLPEINVVDFFNSGYVPEAMLNFLALLGWNPGGDREIMTASEIVDLFDPARFTKSNSLFDRRKLLSFNTEHLRMLDEDRMLVYLKNYFRTVGSPVAIADDQMLRRIISVTKGARTLTEIDAKVRFLFCADDAVVYDPGAVDKVLIKQGGLAVLDELAVKLAELAEVTPASIEKLMGGMAEEKKVGLGKIAQPLRVAICGNTVSPPIFDSVDMLGMKRTLARIKNTICRFRKKD